tara:strand:+ start:356 stop:577 length:222 start_codon:yes stop_codon:yes gene_type:complete
MGKIQPTPSRPLYNNAQIQQIVKGNEMLGEEVKRLRDVLSTLDEMIKQYVPHPQLMKALEQGLGLPETWEELL